MANGKNVNIYIFGGWLWSICNFNSSCFVKEKFHCYCPGCGFTRACDDLIHLRFMHSLKYNIMPIPLLLLIFSLFLSPLFERNDGKYHWAHIRNKLLKNVLVIWILYFAARNILLAFGIDLIGDF